MRLTLLNQFYRPDISPTAHLSASLAEHRAQRGDEVTVVTSKGGYVQVETGEQQATENPAVHRVWTPQLGKKTKLRRLIDYGCFYIAAAWHLLTLPKQDVIVAMTTPPFIAWAAVFHKLIHRECKLVLWNMDCYPEIAERTGVIREGGVISRFLRWMNRGLFRRIDHLVCLDTAMVDLLIGAYGAPGGGPPTTIIPNWEDLSLFPAGVEHEPWSPQVGDAEPPAFRVLYLGNTGSGHTFDTALAAAERLRESGVQFLFVGGGSRWESIREAVEQRGLSHVVLHPYVPKEQTPRLMASADAAMITLRDDSLGVMSPSKLHANLAMGLPIVYVGPAKSNVDDAIRQYDCGVSLRDGEVDAMVAFIQNVMSDPAKKQTLRQAARGAFEAAYCDVVTLERFDTLLDGIHPD